jgi:hypothetical protein
MVSSGTYSWQLNISDIVDEAYELAGWEARDGNDLITARRSLNLLLTEWASKGVNLWTIEEDSLDLVAGTAAYNLGPETVDVLTVMQRDTDSIDTNMTRISIEEYMSYPDKSAQGSISQFALQKGATQPTLYVYPTPNDSTVDLVFWKVRYSQDINRYTETPDLPRRFIPALIFGLAWYLSLKKPSVAGSEEAGKLDGQKRVTLETRYKELFEEAKGEDRDKASLFLLPGGYR